MAPVTAVVREDEQLPVRESCQSKSYSQILRSSALIGGSSAITAAVGLVRVKAMALMLGPTGFGLMGAFTTVADLARVLSSFGVGSSGVRQIAEAAGLQDMQRVVRTAAVLRRLTLVLGIVGAAILLVFARPIAVLTFGDDRHTLSISLLSLAVFFQIVADGQGAVLQGMRRVGDIARIAVYAALLSAVVSTVVIYCWREQGVAAAIVVIAATSLVFSWRYSRKVVAERAALETATALAETSALLRVGLAFMLSAVLTMAAAYAVRLILIRQHGLEAAGLYQAASTVGGMYIVFVLQAMSTDFYPRLVAAASDNRLCNRLVNEQAQVSLLLAGAGVIGTLTLAPWLMTVMYSGEFQKAAELLRWLCLGMALRVITWPMGYILVAKGKQALFVCADLLWTLVNVISTWWCVERFGLVGAGIAFFGSYVFHFFIVYPVCRRLSDFRWSPVNLKLGVAYATAISIVHCSFYVLETRVAVAVGLVTLAAVAAMSYRALRRLVGSELLPRKLTQLISPKAQQ